MFWIILIVRCIIRQQPIILQCGVLNVLDYFHCLMHNSPAADDFQCGVLKVMYYFKCVMHNSPEADDFAMWSVKCFGLFSLCDA